MAVERLAPFDSWLKPLGHSDDLLAFAKAMNHITRYLSKHSSTDRVH